MQVTPTQASAIATGLAVAILVFIIAFNLGRYDAVVKIRSACDVDNRSHLKAGYYTEVAR